MSLFSSGAALDAFEDGFLNVEKMLSQTRILVDQGGSFSVHFRALTIKLIFL